MRWKDFPEMSDSCRTCRGLNLERELNDARLLKRVHKLARKAIGIEVNQPINSDVLSEKLGEAVFQYAKQGQGISSDKVLALVDQANSKRQAFMIIGYTVICLLESYGLVTGPKL